jgi:hypothetical protein
MMGIFKRLFGSPMCVGPGCTDVQEQRPTIRQLCHYNLRGGTHIIHVCNTVQKQSKRFTNESGWIEVQYSNNQLAPYTNDGVIYIPLLHTEDSGEQIKQALPNLMETACKDMSNVLVFCSSRLLDVSTIMNDFLRDQTRQGKGWLNATIIHESENTGQVLYSDNVAVRKVLNIFPRDGVVDVQGYTKFDKDSLVEFDKESLMDSMSNTIQEDSNSSNSNLSSLLVLHFCNQTIKATNDISTTSPARKKVVLCSRNDVLTNEMEGGNGEVSSRPSGGSFYFKARQVEPVEAGSRLQEAWWYTMHFDERPDCLVGRFRQMHRTCWMNAVMNLFFLTPEITTLVKERLPHLLSKVKNKSLLDVNLESCPVARMPAFDRWVVIANNVLFKGQRLTMTSPDSKSFMQNVADVSMTENEKARKGTKIPIYDFTSITLMKTLLSEHKDFIVINDYVDNVASKIKKSEQFNDKCPSSSGLLGKWCKYLGEKSACFVWHRDHTTMSDFVQRVKADQKFVSAMQERYGAIASETSTHDDFYNTYPDIPGIHSLMSSDPKLKVASVTSEDLQMVYGLQVVEGQDPPRMIVYRPLYESRGELLPEIITLDGTYSYMLRSAIIYPNKNHGIVGLTCGKHQYLYDSNFRLPIEQDWTNLDLQEYYRQTRDLYEDRNTGTVGLAVYALES